MYIGVEETTVARKTQAETQATRTALLRAALRVFSRDGYAAARLEDVAQEAGVTRGAIYWHFPSKADLYAALVEDATTRLDEVIAAARGGDVRGGGTFVETTRRVMVRMLAYLEEDETYRAVQTLLLLQTGLAPELARVRARELDVLRATEAELTAVMRAGVAAGDFRADLDPEEGARAMLAYLNGIMLHWFLTAQAFSLTASAPALVDIYLRGITAHPEPPQPLLPGQGRRG
jgi:TetR/AcrR family acrAB operon transcriptional repressor